MKLPENTMDSILIRRDLLSRNEDERSVYLLRLSLPDTQCKFEPGDVVYICPENNSQWIARCLAILQANPSKMVLNEEGKSVALGNALKTEYELRLRPSVLAQFNEEQANDFWLCLAELRAQKGKDFDEQDVLSWLKPMRPRAYSIASAQKLLPNVLEVIVGLVTFRDVKGGVCEGLSSGFLCKRLPIGGTVKIYVKSSRFRLPQDPTRPVIMVGPGTGIAPFKAFLEHRKAIRATGKNWLFFGGRYRENDFLLQDFLENLKYNHHLTRLDLAFSRDQAYKIYVQDRMKEQAQALWSWFQQGAYFYICGDAKNMAKDVEEALLTIIQEQERLSLEEAQIYLKDLRLAGRYQKDVY